jgi:hypothetical protein
VTRFKSADVRVIPYARRRGDVPKPNRNKKARSGENQSGPKISAAFAYSWEAGATTASNTSTRLMRAALPLRARR